MIYRYCYLRGVEEISIAEPNRSHKSILKPMTEEEINVDLEK